MRELSYRSTFWTGFLYIIFIRGRYNVRNLKMW